MVACQAESGPPLVASAVQVFLPLPGNEAAVAYFTLENSSSEPIVIATVSSPQFVLAEVHETTLKNGVARMRRIEQWTLAAGTSASLEPGGMHLMLMRPIDNLAVDSIVTLEIHYDQTGLIIIDARVKARNQQ